MSVSFYDLLKYARTGIASPEMTAFEKYIAQAMAGGETAIKMYIYIGTDGKAYLGTDEKVYASMEGAR